MRSAWTGEQYENRIRQLLDKHVVAREVVTLVEPLNIFDDIAIETRRKEKTETDASIADTIAHRLTRSIEEKWDEDPVFFEKFSKLIRDTIADFHNGRISEVAYLTKIRELRDKVQHRQDNSIPRQRDFGMTAMRRHSGVSRGATSIRPASETRNLPPISRSR